MKLIPLTQEKFAKVDDVDYERLIKYKWWAYFNNGNWYAWSRGPTRSNNGIRMHNFILNDRGIIDHENGDGLDNQRHNLRPANHAENGRNRGLNVNNSSGYKGVSWDTARQKWAARIMVNRKTINLGRFDSMHDAGRAYNKAAVEHFKEFAWLNKIIEDEAQDVISLAIGMNFQDCKEI